MGKADLKQLERQLSIIVGLLAKLVVTSTLEPGASQQKQIEVLSSVGLQNSEIAEILGTTTGTVRGALRRLRKRTN